MSTEKSLDDFQWDDNSDTFFGLNSQGVPVEDEPAKVVEKEEDVEPEDTDSEVVTKRKPVEKVTKEEGDDEDDFFFGVGEDDDNVPASKETDQEGGSIFGDLYEDLKEQNILKHVQLEEGEELDAERFSEIMEEEYESEVDSRLANWAQKDLDEDAQAFIKFKRQGGSTQDFFRLYSNSSELPVGDIKDEKYQDKVIRLQLEQEGWEDDEIEDRLEHLTSNGRKAKFAERALKKIKEEEAIEKEALLEQQQRVIEANKKSQKEYLDNLSSTLGELDEVKGLKITPKDKKDLVSFITKPTHVVGDRKITGLQQKLGEVFKDAEKTVLLAKLLNSDFDLSDVSKKASTKTTKEIKSKLEQRRTKSSGSSFGGKSVADYFTED